jgi:hypothetical protein
MAAVALGVTMVGAWFLAGPVGSDVAVVVGRALDASAAWIHAKAQVNEDPPNARGACG